MKWQYAIGNRILNFEGSTKKEAEIKAIEWQKEHSTQKGIVFTQKVKTSGKKFHLKRTA